MNTNRYKEFPIYGFAVPVHGSRDIWHSQGIVLAPDKTRTVELQRIEGGSHMQFSTKEEAEQHGLKLCKEWIDHQNP